MYGMHSYVIFSLVRHPLLLSTLPISSVATHVLSFILILAGERFLKAQGQVK